jgi:GNAT superfamily N-acetyltransferase
MIRVRDAAIYDGDWIVEFNARMARETEGLDLDRYVLSSGVRAVLADPAKGRYFMAECREPSPHGPWICAGQLMITREFSDWRNGVFWWIQSVYVVEALRRRGVFRALYQHVRQQAHAAGAVGLRLYVEKNNAIGQATYRGLGMVDSHYQVMQELFRP